jgi:hypothetical protein
MSPYIITYINKSNSKRENRLQTIHNKVTKYFKKKFPDGDSNLGLTLNRLASVSTDHYTFKD